MTCYGRLVIYLQKYCMIKNMLRHLLSFAGTFTCPLLFRRMTKVAIYGKKKPTTEKMALPAQKRKQPSVLFYNVRRKWVLRWKLRHICKISTEILRVYIFWFPFGLFFCFLLVCCFWTGTLVCRNFPRWQLSEISSASWLAAGEPPPLLIFISKE